MKDDEIALRIEAFDAANGGGVGWYKDKGAYHLYLLTTKAPITRLKPVGTTDEVRLGYWSHRRRWEDTDDMGGCVLPLDKTLDHIANNSVFWTWTCRKMYKAELRRRRSRQARARPRSGPISLPRPRRRTLTRVGR